MKRLSTKQLARYAADQLELGKKPGIVSKNIAAVLIAQNSSHEVLKFGRSLEQELVSRGITQVTITSALKLELSTMSRLSRALGVQNPLFHEVIDESIINGARAETSDLQLDLTVSHKLAEFKQEVAGLSNA